MAEALDVSKNTVNRLWQLHNIKPHLSRTFKPNFPLTRHVSNWQSMEN
jgi:hypothetical protein